MNSKERLLEVLRGGIPDRVPVSLFVQEEYLSYFYPGKEIDRVKTATECAEYYGFDIITKSKEFEPVPYFFKRSYPNWELSEETWEKDRIVYTRHQIRTPAKTLQEVIAVPDTDHGTAGVSASVREYLIKDESDIEAFIKYVPDIDKDTLAHMKEFCEWSHRVIGDKGIAAPWMWGGVYNKATELRDIQELMVDPYDDPELYEAFMGKILELQLKMNTEFAKLNGMALSMQGNIANAGMVSKSFFDEYILPYEKPLVEAVQACGSYIIYHNCGKSQSLQKSYVDMGLAAWETVAEAPQGDTTLAYAKKNVGDKLTLIGNLDQVHFLKEASTDEVYAKAREVVETGKPGGRYIFSCSDFLEKNTPEENVKAMVKAAIEYGRY